MRRSLAGGAAAFALVMGSAAPALPQDCCAIFAPSPIPSLSRSQLVNLPVTVTNTGDVVWRGGIGGTSWGLSYITRKGNNWVAIGPLVLFPKDVHKGETVTLTVPLRAPSAIGSFIVTWYIATSEAPLYDDTFHFGEATYDESLVVKRPLLHYSALQSWLAGSKASSENPATAWHLPSIEYVAGRSDTEVTTFTTVGGRNFDGGAVGRLDLKLADGTLYSPYPTYWTDIEASVMFDVSGELDQPATLQIVRADGTRSNEWPVMFRAGQQDLPFPPGLVGVECATAGGTTDFCGPERRASPPQFLVGFHESDCCVQGDSGTDSYALPPLLNGWRYTAMLFQVLGNVEGSASPLSDITPGPQGQTIKVAWSTPLHQSISYTIMIRIEGPNGVAFH